MNVARKNMNMFAALKVLEMHQEKEGGKLEIVYRFITLWEQVSVL
jgi:hypothetical protein